MVNVRKILWTYVNEIHIQDGLQIGTHENSQKGEAPPEDFIEETVDGLIVQGTECFERTFCSTKCVRDVLHDVVEQNFDKKMIKNI